MKRNRIAFFFILPIRTNPVLITMPFGINVIKLLAKKGCKVDVFLSEYKSNVYNEEFPNNVDIKYIDQNILWRNKEKYAYFMVTKYFRLLSKYRLKNKYDYIFTSGMSGITLGSILKEYNRKASLVYMNDEFPEGSGHKIWEYEEIKNALNADYVIVPDESRFAPLAKQIKELDKITHLTLPNTPLKEDLKDIPAINWHEYFKIPMDKKIFLSAGGIGDLYFISEILNSVKAWPDNTTLILKGKNNIDAIKQKYNHLALDNKVIWCSDNFSPDELHSLIKYSTASICLYRNENDNIYFMGKSSGKLMRSIALGKPVIASNFKSLNFVEELKIGKQAGNEAEIAEAVKYIIANEIELQSNCSKTLSHH